MVKNPPTNAGDEREYRFNPCSGRSPGVENGKPFQYSCLGNPMSREAWWVTVHRWQRAGHDSAHSTHTRFLMPILAWINYHKHTLWFTSWWVLQFLVRVWKQVQKSALVWVEDFTQQWLNWWDLKQDYSSKTSNKGPWKGEKWWKVIFILYKSEGRIFIRSKVVVAAAAAVKSPQSCPTLCDPIDGSPLGSSIHMTPQARMLEWVAVSLSMKQI